MSYTRLNKRVNKAILMFKNIFFEINVGKKVWYAWCAWYESYLMSYSRANKRVNRGYFGV